MHSFFIANGPFAALMIRGRLGFSKVSIESHFEGIAISSLPLFGLAAFGRLSERKMLAGQCDEHGCMTVDLFLNNYRWIQTLGNTLQLSY